MDYIWLGIPAVFYLGFPLVIKFSQNVDPNPRIEAVSPSEWPATVAQTMSRVEHDLYSLGFTITARYKMSGAIPDTATMLTMLVNYKTGDKAMITAIWGCANGVWRLGTHYTEFSTRFEDGYCFDTLNSATLSSFQHGPKDIKTRVPQIQEAADLWALHRFVMRKHGAQGRKIVYDMQQSEAYFRRIWREGFEEQVRFGRFVFSCDKFQPSFTGAYLMSWGIMWPMSLIRKAQMKARATAIVREWKDAGNTNESAFDETRVVILPEPQPVLSN